jgi:hypothetical protein
MHYAPVIANSITALIAVLWIRAALKSLPAHVHPPSGKNAGEHLPTA